MSLWILANGKIVCVTSIGEANTESFDAADGCHAVVTDYTVACLPDTGKEMPFMPRQSSYERAHEKAPWFSSHKRRRKW